MSRDNKKIPVPVRIIAVWFAIYAGVFVTASLLCMYLLLLSLSNLFNPTEKLIPLVISLALAAIFYLTARGLWNGNNKARISAIVVCLVLTVVGIVGLFRSANLNICIIAVLNVFFLMYLFTKKVRQVFIGNRVSSHTSHAPASSVKAN